MKKIIILLFTFFVVSSHANALIKVDITRGNLDPLPIAVSPLHVDPNTNTPYTQPPAAEACKLLERLASDPGIVAVNTTALQQRASMQLRK